MKGSLIVSTIEETKTIIKMNLMKSIFAIIFMLLLAAIVESCNDSINENDTILNKTKNLNLIYPIGGEEFFIEDTLRIRWEEENIDKINIYAVNTQNEKILIRKNVEAKDTLYKWSIPVWNFAMLKMLIVDKSDSSVSDITDDYFKLVPKKEINLTYPLGGEEFSLGDTVNIKWESKNNPNNLVSIYYITERGEKNLIASTVQDNHSYKWVVPYMEYDELKVKFLVEMASDSNIYDMSDDYIILNLNTGVNGLEKFPLNIGNVWFYKVDDLGSSESTPYAVRKEITGTTSDGFTKIKVTQFYNSKTETHLGYWFLENNKGFYSDIDTLKNDWEFNYYEDIYLPYVVINNYSKTTIEEKVDTVWTKIVKSQIRIDRTYSPYLNRSHETSCNPYFLITYEREKSSTEVVPIKNYEAFLVGAKINDIIWGDTTIVSGVSSN